jgi:trimethylamine--corrinoid protein Co-methyltransferase
MITADTELRVAQLRPSLCLLSSDLVERVIEEAFELLMDPGVRIGTSETLALLAAAGARTHEGIAHIPRALAERCLRTVPRSFYLHDRAGNPAVHYGGDQVHFDPGSSCLNILDPETHQARPAQTADLVRLVQVAEMLPQYAAQSTAMVCNDVPQDVGDFYRLLVVLRHSSKPVVTGAFSGKTLAAMLDLLIADSGCAANLRQMPRAVFDVCPSPPLNWSDFASENLLQLARAGVPAEIVSMPLAGATAPVTLIGSVVQHAAECISGITIHQLAGEGSPIVWGGAPAIFDMSTGSAPMGAMETAMLNLACTQVGKHLGLPTHGYLVATDSRHVDAQAGMESATSAALGALAGINMISGAGMLDALACHSVEKLIIDAEAIASAQRIVQGVQVQTDTLAAAIFRQVGLSGEFLKTRETRALFRNEQHFPSSVIQRGELLPGEPEQDSYQRARHRSEELVSAYSPPAVPPSITEKVNEIAGRVLG